MGATAAAVDVGTGATLAAAAATTADDEDVGAIIPPPSTEDKDVYVGTSAVFEGTCVGTFADGTGQQWPPSNAATNQRAMTSSSLNVDNVAQGSRVPSIAVISHHRPPVRPPPPTAFLRCRLLPLLIVKCPSILTLSSHLTPPLFYQYTPRSPHIVRVTQFTVKRCVGWCVVLTNPMDCDQIEHRRHRPWCADDAYAVGWGTLMPQAMVWAKAA